ncbi:DUF2202 domain-containing protein [Methanotrichaceae archaeon M04Ac]|uniref:DUF2202 domain-containing protein n=1 Tax=Candidatus Methanocrinis alkalitolerans TaxID=3033395 RepID=A0ABT5XDI8_9EURY|nr:DUF2202 domain-containing protein [Candidatus Methanocrinis alkalitolerans]MCR3884649.1 DUF2202 domain-containing protein [Methanothrix sp.]MDF0592758.1 DUF2202 domain-containing protein [Candidatus Methanocrinis alkalitolerans]
MKLLPLILLTALLILSGCVEREGPGTEAVEEAEVPAEPGAWNPDGIIAEGEYSGYALLIGPVGLGYPGGDLEVFWRADKENLYMALRGETTGWMAVGFDPQEWKKGADVVIGRVDGKDAVVEDQYIIDFFGPHFPDVDLGGTDDILQFGGLERDGVTVIEFKRRLDTGDEFDRAITPGEDLPIIWSISRSEDLNEIHDVARAEGILRLGDETAGPSAIAPLSVAELDGMAFILEEERMARDLYMEFYKMTRLPVFLNVAGSEKIHIASILTLMNRRGIPAPQEDPGVYADEALQRMYEDLLAGADSPEAALRAAAQVEEASVHDLSMEIEGTLEPDLMSVYGGLMVGSEKHLRTFVRALEERGGEYTPAILSQEEFDRIVR